MGLTRDPCIYQEIIQLLADGLSTKMIAHRMKYEISTIDTYRVMILREHNVKNTAQLISHCYQIGKLKIKTANRNETKTNEDYRLRQAG